LIAWLSNTSRWHWLWPQFRDEPQNLLEHLPEMAASAIWKKT